MSPPKNGNGLWKQASGAMLCVLLTLFSVWVSGGFSRVTRGEAIALVKTHSPYVEDRKVILESIKANTAAIGDLTRENRKHASQVAELIGELRATRKQ